MWVLVKEACACLQVPQVVLGRGRRMARSHASDSDLPSCPSHLAPGQIMGDRTETAAEARRQNYINCCNTRLQVRLAICLNKLAIFWFVLGPPSVLTTGLGGWAGRAWRRRHGRRRRVPHPRAPPPASRCCHPGCPLWPEIGLQDPIGLDCSTMEMTDGSVPC